MEWHQVIEIVRGHLVRISTPSKTGTGFLLTSSADAQFMSVATAAHVIEHAHAWEEPIRITHDSTGQTTLLRPGDRAINLRADTDTAAISFKFGSLPLPPVPLPLIAFDFNVKPGVEIGWIGFPGIFSLNACFFSGRVSFWLEKDRAYLVDGVVIHGVSGAPALYTEGDRVEVIGVVTNYYVNRQVGEALPGLGAVRDVRHFQELLQATPDFAQAQAQETPPKPVAEPSPPPAEDDEDKAK